MDTQEVPQFFDIANCISVYFELLRSALCGKKFYELLYFSDVKGEIESDE